MLVRAMSEPMELFPAVNPPKIDNSKLVEQEREDKRLQEIARKAGGPEFPKQERKAP